MSHYPIIDWDDAYANASHIPNGMGFLDTWAQKGAQFREEMQSQNRAKLDISYGPLARNKFDLFTPKTESKGLVVFVHGGFWQMLDKSSWSHLAQGSLDAGYSVAMPSYTLCPDASIAQIIAEIGEAISLAGEQVSGEIRLTGHSAGGHLVTSMLCEDSPLPLKVRERIVKTVSISGVHDLRGLLNTQMNENLKLDAAQAKALSPVLKSPAHFAPLTCWVGSDERPEFLRLNKIQAQMWRSFELKTDWVEEPNRHHFDVVDGLVDKNHPLMQSLMA